MPRLFTGIEIPADISAQLALLNGGIANARWIEPENYHITLRFIGDVPADLGREILLELKKIKRSSFDLELSGLDAFGGNKPRSVYAKVKPSEELDALQRQHEVLLQRIGLEPEGRKFTPHVTLARLRHNSAKDVAKYLSLRGGFSSPAFHVPRFVIYSAKESTGGGPYLVEQAYDFDI